MMIRLCEPVELLRQCDEASLTIPKAGRWTSAEVVGLSSLVFGTIYHESGGLIYNYQLAKVGRLENPALGIAQIEAATLRWLMDELRKDTDRLDRFDCFLLGRKAYKCNWTASVPAGIMQHFLQGWTRLNVAFATLLYDIRLRHMPLSLGGIAAAWKEVYNTSEGKGKPAAFISSVEPVRPLLRVEG